MKILHLPLKKKWFDLEAAGIKKQEYREIKPYWIKRLLSYPMTVDEVLTLPAEFKHFDLGQFKNGYAKNAPTITVKIISITVGEGVQEWGALPGKKYFIIQLGDIIATH